MKQDLEDGLPSSQRQVQYRTVTHRFVPVIPDRLEPAVLYLALEHGAAIHLCCCGCGREVVTPLTPTDWRITYDGETVSLSPSVGNWNEACRSHYIINRGQVVSAGDWSQASIAAKRQRDARTKAKYYGVGDDANNGSVVAAAPDAATETTAERSHPPAVLPDSKRAVPTLRRMRRWIFHLVRARTGG